MAEFADSAMAIFHHVTDSFIVDILFYGTNFLKKRYGCVGIVDKTAHLQAADIPMRTTIRYIILPLLHLIPYQKSELTTAAAVRRTGRRSVRARTTAIIVRILFLSATI